MADLFERFDLYAPHVKTLDIYGRNPHFYSLENIHVLNHQLKRHALRSLLPNLRGFNLTSNQSPERSPNLDHWITLLGTVNIKTVLMRPNGIPNWDCVISHGEASSIVASLTSHCPNVRMLCLYPRDDIVDSPMDLGLLGNPWFKSIVRLNELRILSVSDGWLDDRSILSLGELPELVFLEFGYGDFHTGEFEDSGTVNELLPPTAFPKLDTLSLNIHLVDQIYVLELQKMIKNIKKLELNVCLCVDRVGFEDPGANNLDFEESKDLVRRELLPLLANMPKLKELIVMVWSPHEDAVLSVELPEFLDATSLPQLKTVVLDGVHFGSCILERSLGSIWPQLTSLSLSDQDASLRELASIATIPKLSYLMVKLKLTTKYTPANIPRTEHAPLKKINSSEGAELSSELEVINHTAR